MTAKAESAKAGTGTILEMAANAAGKPSEAEE